MTGSRQRYDDSAIYCLLINIRKWKQPLYLIREDAEVMAQAGREARSKGGSRWD